MFVEPAALSSLPRRGNMFVWTIVSKWPRAYPSALLPLVIALLLFALSSCSERHDSTISQTRPSPESLDTALENAAVKAMGDREGAIIVMDPQTGRLRAMVNPRLAFEQAFPPGSAIKPFTALAAMRAGLIDA